MFYGVVANQRQPLYIMYYSVGAKRGQLIYQVYILKVREGVPAFSRNSLSHSLEWLSGSLKNRIQNRFVSGAKQNNSMVMHDAESRSTVGSHLREWP